MNFKIANIFLNILVAYMCVYVTGAVAHDEEYRGIFLWGPELEDFAPCGSEKVYAVSGSYWVLNPLYDDVNDKDKEKSPFKAVYIEFRGHLLDEVLDGFAVDLDGLIRISEIKSYTLNSPAECDLSRSSKFRVERVE